MNWKRLYAGIGHSCKQVRLAIARRAEQWASVCIAPCFLAIVTAISLSLAVPGESASKSRFDASRLQDLLDWIEATLDRDVDGLRQSPPSIVFAEPGEELDLGDQSLMIAPEMGGVWDTETRQIILVQPWNATDPVDLSILLHELVHALQADEGVSVCNPEAEVEAYGLQSSWLAEHDIVMLVDWSEVWEHAPCGVESAP